jgi:hypothetical protein
MRNFLRAFARRACFLAVALSALFCLGLSFLWWQSYRPGPRHLALETEGRLLECDSHDGRAHIQIIRNWPGSGMLGFGHNPNTANMRRRFDAWGVRSFEADLVFHQIYSPTLQEMGVITGGGYMEYSRRPSNRPMPVARVVSVPYSYPVLLSALPVLAWILLTAVRAPRRVRTARRQRRGECLRCGYDLRFSRGKCPECGEPIPLPPTAA